MQRRFLTHFLLLALFTVCASLLAQVPQTATQTAPASDVVTGSGSFSPIVQDLDRSMDFYNDLFEITAPPTATPRPFGNDAPLLNFLGVPTAQVRVGNVRIPGSTLRLEIVDFKDTDRKPVQPRLQDPGAVRLILIVRDLDALLGRLKKKGTPVVTAGGTPVVIAGSAGKARAVVVKDPDGFAIELMQPDPLPETTAPAASNVIGAHFGLTVADTDQTMRVYRDLLGFQFQIDASFTSDKAIAELLNTPNAQVRRSTARIPGSAVQVEFLEFKGIDRKPIGARIQDPGATRLQLRVRDSDATVKALKAAGNSVITTGGDGGPITMSGLRLALVREPNNLFLVIFAQGQAQGQPAAAPAR